MLESARRKGVSFSRSYLADQYRKHKSSRDPDNQRMFGQLALGSRSPGRRDGDPHAAAAAASPLTPAGGLFLPEFDGPEAGTPARAGGKPLSLGAYEMIHSVSRGSALGASGAPRVLDGHAIDATAEDALTDGDQHLPDLDGELPGLGLSLIHI